MTRNIVTMVAATGLLACLLVTTAVAETWTDNTGKFNLEAEFVGVKGKSIVLKKPDGSTIEVPINRLSTESRTRARQLYEMSRGGAEPAGPQSATMPAESSPAASTKTLPVPASSPNVAPRDLNFTPPAPATVPPMAAFPDNTSLQETFDFCRDQLLAGHPEVFWFALPADIREKMDSQEFRDAILPSLQQQAQSNKAIEDVFMKVLEVLSNKKKFVLNSQMMAMVPPGAMPMIQQGYDPTVGLIYEVATLSFDADAIANQTISQMMSSRGPRIGGHLKAILAMVPPGMIDQVTAGIVINENGDSGTITAPNQEGGTETTEMVRHMGRWIPKELADAWVDNKDTFIADMKTELQNAQQGEAATQANMMAGMVTTMANGILDPMLAAENQQDFDAAVMQVMAMASNFMPGGLGGPGGPGGFPGGPGGPGGPEGFPGGF